MGGFCGFFCGFRIESKEVFLVWYYFFGFFGFLIVVVGWLFCLGIEFVLLFFGRYFVCLGRVFLEFEFRIGFYIG